MSPCWARTRRASRTGPRLTFISRASATSERSSPGLNRPSRRACRMASPTLTLSASDLRTGRRFGIENWLCSFKIEGPPGCALLCTSCTAVHKSPPSSLAAKAGSVNVDCKQLSVYTGSTEKEVVMSGLALGLLLVFQWKAGVGRNVITPAEPIWLSGYEDRTRPSEGVLRDLYVKALALQDETGRTAVLVTADILGYTRETGTAVADLCRERFGLSRDRLVLNASHTHSAPVIDPPGWPAHPLMPEAQRPVVKRYGAVLVERTVEAIGEAIRNLAPARVRFGQGFAAIGVNRRRAVINRGLTGQVDQDVPVLAVESAGGKLLAVVA